MLLAGVAVPRPHNKHDLLFEHDLLFAKRSGSIGGGGGDFVRVDRFGTHLGLEAPILVAEKSFVRQLQHII